MFANTLRACAPALGLALLLTQASAQTDGTAKFEGTLLDYNGTGTKHWTVVWVSRQNGTFIKSLRKQGPAITDTHWRDHCAAWWNAKGTSTALDGYSSATASTYSGTNSPVIIDWNCRDASNALVPDGTYVFWMQYAENSGQGPYTTNGITWVKGPAGATNTYANIPSRITELKVTWIPAVTATAPTITSTAPPTAAKVGVPYSFTCTASGSAPITFTATSLPTGLSMSTAGVIAGTPTAAGTFNGTITAANGTAPNATQPFSITVTADPVNISTVTTEGGNLIFRGTGPANGNYSVLGSPSILQPIANWNLAGSGKLDASGAFNYTSPPVAGGTQQFYRVRVP